MDQIITRNCASVLFPQSKVLDELHEKTWIQQVMSSCWEQLARLSYLRTFWSVFLFFHRLDSTSPCFQEGIILPVFLYPVTRWTWFEEPAFYHWCSESLWILAGAVPYVSNYGLYSKLLEGVLSVYCILSLQKLRAVGGSPDKGERLSFLTPLRT